MENVIEIKSPTDKRGNALKIGSKVVGNHGRMKGLKGTISQIEEEFTPKGNYRIILEGENRYRFSHTFLREDIAEARL